MSVHSPRRSRVFWLVGLALLGIGVLGLFGFWQGWVRQRPEIQVPPLERQVRSANAQARLVSLKAEVFADRPAAALEQQYRIIVDALTGLDVGSEDQQETWDAVAATLANLEVQLVEADRETLATIDSLLTLLHETGASAQSEP